MELLGVLKELEKCLIGKWFIGDGALLGIIRGGGLISYDNDIDIYILEGTEIDLNDSCLKKHQYYKEKIIIPQFTKNHIDIFTLKKGDDGRYVTKWPNLYFTEEELQLVENYSLGFKVFIPADAEGVLERQYGKDWRTPNKDFKYY